MVAGEAAATAGLVRVSAASTSSTADHADSGPARLGFN